MRGVPVNVNYRYLDDELWYLLDNADAEALVFHSSLGDRVARVVDATAEAEAADRGRRRRHRGPVAGALPYEDVVAAHEPMERIDRSDDDIYMLYTGGTTGMPKGVMYDMASHDRLVPAVRLPVPRPAGAARRPTRSRRSVAGDRRRGQPRWSPSRARR